MYFFSAWFLLIGGSCFRPFCWALARHKTDDCSEPAAPFCSTIRSLIQLLHEHRSDRPGTTTLPRAICGAQDPAHAITREVPRDGGGLQPTLMEVDTFKTISFHKIKRNIIVSRSALLGSTLDRETHDYRSFCLRLHAAKRTLVNCVLCSID